ncbi:ubiquinone biosynthesis protein COQ4 [Microseira wollei]|uniref:Uncharacterized protein n=1 Tax=Microseira wollei NIES-4236 TaxID=2530354 RepID=A0AAV3XEZ7_9CYAN|nr:ubiquinone biosynthesis protein COQ4 [Microseira wollei]GET39435.1 hypothetical protein MiSe_42040 [Microseira wollei NIES-4236]
MNENFGSSTLITLGEAIQKLRASQHEGDMTNKMSAEITQALDRHDAVHVLFNCGTSMEDEIAAHIWMVFGTTAKISKMHRAVANQEHRNVLSNIGHLKLIGIWFTCLPRIIAIISKSLRMKKRLAVEELSQLKEQSIVEIRREHGIVL